MSQSTVSTIIVSYRCAEALEQTLRHLLPQRVNGGMEVIVVDNDSGDNTPDIARGFDGVKLIEPGANLGFSAGNNLGAENASGEYLFILNPDVILPEGLVQALVDEIEGRPEAAAVGPKVIDANGELSRFCARKLLTKPGIAVELAGLESTFVGRPARRGYFYPTGFYDTGPAAVPVLSGCCMLVRRSTFEDVGGFDERFFLFAEDIDLCARLCAAGWSVIYSPVGPVTHMVGQSMGVSNPKVAAAGANSLLYYTEKHFSRPAAGLFRVWYRFTLWSRYIISSALGVFSRKWRERSDMYRGIISLHEAEKP
ncbi:MAG: glycosyltransferase family 2 protein [bacterium]|nr:glycosyltransferase family 2 protein [bacterium]